MKSNIKLTEDQLMTLMRLTFERDGFKVLLKEFTMGHPLSTEFNLNEKEWKDLQADYLKAISAINMLVNSITNDMNAFKTFDVDFNTRILSWEGAPFTLISFSNKSEKDKNEDD